MKFNEKVYRLVKEIPRGKVTTYGQISRELIINPQIVGWMLHQNKDPNIPCHRVVDRSGRLAPNFAGPPKPWRRRLGPSKLQRSGAFDGAQEQRRRLAIEGVKFIDEMHVDLNKCLW